MGDRVSAGWGFEAFPFVCSLMFALCCRVCSSASRAVKGAVTDSLDPAARGRGFTSLPLQSHFATMHSHLVIPVFIRHLLAMVVEIGVQNRIHLGEPEPFALGV